MRCNGYRGDLIELARGGPARPGLMSHIETCADCARFLDDQIALTTAMRGIAAETRNPGMALEARVMAEFPDGRVPLRRWTVAAGVLLAACITAFSMLHRMPAPTPRADMPQFVNIPYTVPLAPDEPAAVWRAKIPVSALIGVGFHVGALDPSATVEADILVSQDGRARAIRPVSISTTN
jgi:hypothetical protein